MHIAFFTERPYPHVSKEQILKSGFFGTPATVIPKLNKVLDLLRPGIFSF